VVFAEPMKRMLIVTSDGPTAESLSDQIRQLTKMKVSR